MSLNLVLSKIRLLISGNRTKLKTGALCCIVASGPLVTTKPPPHSGRRDIASLSQDDDLQWRMNLSYSPAGCNTRDGLEEDMSDQSPEFALPSSTSRSRNSLEFCFQQSPRWGLSATGGNEQKPCTANSIPVSISSLNEDKGFDLASAAPSFRSLSSLSEPTAPSETSRNQPFSLSHCSYPQVFCNPVSDCEVPKPDHRQEDSSTNHVSISMISTRNNQDSPAEEASPNSTSHDMSLDIERSNKTEEENPKLKPASTTYQRCGVCKKPLSQKSPWSSNKILKSRDMPTAAVFPCHHVYHVECLDKVTPTTQTRDPLCPICSNTAQPLVMPETLQMALRSFRRNHTAMESETLNNDNQRTHTRTTRRRHKWEILNCCFNKA